MLGLPGAVPGAVSSAVPGTAAASPPAAWRQTLRQSVAPAWLTAQAGAASLAPLRPRAPLWVASAASTIVPTREASLATSRQPSPLPASANRGDMGADVGVEPIGSVEPDLFDQIGLQRLSDGRFKLQKHEHFGVNGWLLSGDTAAGLQQLALALRAAGLAGAWRDEALAVCNEGGVRLGAIERAAVRALGIATQAVHLVGWRDDGRLWVQQRSLTKANDPGLWDTLMGGMVSAADTVQSALARETWEEAGVQLSQLHGLSYGGRIEICRPSSDAGGGFGYMVERIDWFQAVLPDGLQPVNQDGEVALFRTMAIDEAADQLQRQAFTLEAALVLCAQG